MRSSELLRLSVEQLLQTRRTLEMELMRCLTVSGSAGSVGHNRRAIRKDLARVLSLLRIAR
jgi:ribosomal protein L29